MKEYKSGFIAIIGKPNSGKSTLVNALIGEKVSIVSPKAQTTRNNIMGILNNKDYQLVFIDTPGINKANNKLDDYMQKSIKGAVSDVNVIIITIDGSKKFTQEDSLLIEKYKQLDIPIVVVLTKIDLMEQAKIFEDLSKLGKLGIQEIVPVSSIKEKNLDELIKVLLQYIPCIDRKDKYFDEDMYTDKSLRFIASEIIREKSLYHLDAEIPHGIAVEILKFEEYESIIEIDVNLICEKESHKSIIIGKNGLKLKKIGHDARVSFQKVARKKVNLNLWVKVNKNWRENIGFLTEVGYNKSELD